MDGSDEEEEAEGREVIVAEITDRRPPLPRRSGRCVQKKLDFHGARGGADDPDGDDEVSDRERRGKRKRRKGKETDIASGRCVQKKLDLYGTRGSAGDQDDAEEKIDRDDAEEKIDRERRGKGKRKGAEKAAAAKKTSSGKELRRPRKNVSDFFMTLSEKKIQKKIKMENQITSSLEDECGEALHHIEGNKDHDLSCGQVKNSRNHSDTTPKKSRSPCSGKKMSDMESIIANSPHKMVEKNQPVLDLWFQAKIDAEENQRLSEGKKIHPFFSSWKASNKTLETSEIDKAVNNPHLNLVDQCPPIHVFETEEETTAPFNWNNWNLNHVSLLSSDGFSPDYTSVAIFEFSVEPLRFGSDTSIPILETNEEIPMDHLNEMKRSSQQMETISSPLTNSQEAQPVLLSYLKEIFGGGSTHQSRKCCSSNNSLTTMQETPLHDRLISYQLRRGFGSDHYLWTSKYRPEKTSEVCGNADAVMIIRDWLQSWRDGYFQKSSNIRDKVSMDTDSNCSSFEDCSETESEEEEGQLGNVLLVTGPVGCGKSAAIYACAKEKGFEVIEVNASDQRNGTLVKQKFGEATESHGLDICSVKDFDNGDQEGCHLLNLSSKENIGTDFNDPEVASWTSSKDFRVHDLHVNTIDSKETTCQVTNKTLLLFEDVDTIFDEDRGFLGTIFQLAETSKRPIILTTNSRDPELPRLLVRQVVNFVLPSHEELLSLASLICAAEELFVSPLLLKRLVRSCQSDIRKTISNLQFWCQGGKDGYKFSPDRSSQFELDAVHLIIPRIIPLGFPCKLSEMVAEEISRAILATKEKPVAIVAVKQESNSMNNIASTEADSDKENACIRSIANLKKTPFPLNDGETSNFSQSPIKITRRNKVFKSSSAVSSDSEEGYSNHPPTDGDRSEFFTDRQSPETSLVPVSFSMGCDNDANQFNISINESESQEPFQCPSWPSGTKGNAETWENSVSVDVSCIPESEFLSTSEFNRRADHVPIASDETSTSPLKLMQACDEKRGDNSMHPQSRIENACHHCAESVHGTEDLHDLEIGRTEFLNIGPFVDECSRVGFGTRIASAEEENPFDAVETVQKTWARLCNSSKILKSYLTDDQKIACQTLKLVSQMTNLVSDANIMLGDCTSIMNDFVQPNMIPCIEPHSMSWCDQLLEMASIFGEHGLCHYVKSSPSIDLKLPCEKVNLLREVLGCSSNLMVLGKLLSRENAYKYSFGDENMHMKNLTSGSCLERDVRVNLCNSILPMIPLKSCMVLKGHAFHEYASSLSYISKLENSRLSQQGINGERRQRRARASQHYLQAYPCSLSPKDVALLAQQFCFGMGPTE